MSVKAGRLNLVTRGGMCDTGGKVAEHLLCAVRDEGAHDVLQVSAACHRH
jgi:hypothetical protein